jgi:hypothetical protein
MTAEPQMTIPVCRRCGNPVWRCACPWIVKDTAARSQDTKRDATRYRWLKETFFEATFPGLYDSPIGGGVTSEQFDADIDAEIAKESARA